jgi:hypothetical protein
VDPQIQAAWDAGLPSDEDDEDWVVDPQIQAAWDAGLPSDEDEP